MMNREKSLLLLAAGTTLAIALPAAAQPANNGTSYGPTKQINVSGATLLSNLFTAPAISNDYIDADSLPATNAGAGIARRNPFNTNQNLAPIGYPPDNDFSSLPYNYWSINYAEVGSVNGLQELINFGTIPATLPSQLTASRSAAFYNRQRYIGTGSVAGLANTGNFGQAPTSQTSASDFSVIDPALDPGWAGVYRNDVAPLDVPARWGVLTVGTPVVDEAFSKLPGQTGYGTYSVKALSRTGVPIAGSNNKLAALAAIPAYGGDANLFDPSNPGAANSRTIFDTPIVFAPIAPITSFGTGKQTSSITELRHLFVTGRLPSGENLHAVVRDSGSGTRNGWMNSLGIDPSWGKGDGTGSTFAANGQSQDAGRPAEGLLGANYVSSNKTGTGDVESAVFNHRLAIGYVGAERANNTGWALTSSLSSVARCEILGVTHDLIGGASPVRPTYTALLDNDPAAGGWTLGGPASLATMGDPRSAPADKGGYGFVLLEANPGHPAMPNVEAAAFVNNITRSVDNFIDDPLVASNDFTPAEFMARNFLLVPAQDKAHSLTNPMQMVTNTALNQDLQNYIAGNTSFVYRAGCYTAFGNGKNITQVGVSGKINGRAPTRTALTGLNVYSDGVALGANYIDMSGNAIVYAAASGLNDRNRISGDFNADGLRNSDDITDMVKAWRHRNTGGFTWTPPVATGAIAGAPASDTCIEIIGDFDGDGNFNAADVRYFADGLALYTGSLNRKSGFTDVDAAFAASAAVPPVNGIANFFGTTKATGGAPANRPWNNGDSRGDVAGATGVAPGWAPVGANGAINAADIDYVFKQFQTNPAAAIVPFVGKQVDWANLNHAATFDLSADMTGDRKVDLNDVKELVNVVLLTEIGDLNFDGVVDAADIAIATTWIAGGGGSSRPGTYANGDVNGDGVVDAADVLAITRAQCRADVTDLGGNGGPDGLITVDDLTRFLSAFFSNDLYVADCAVLGGNPGRDAQITVDDLTKYLSLFFAPCP